LLVFLKSFESDTAFLPSFELTHLFMSIRSFALSLSLLLLLLQSINLEVVLHNRIKSSNSKFQMTLNLPASHIQARNICNPS